MRSEVVVAEGLTKYYGDKLGVEDVTFTVRKGEVFAYLGPNGAGKTTTIRLMLGFLKPTRGRAMVFGVDTRDDGGMSRVKSRIGYVPEDFGLPRGFRGREVLEHISRIRGSSARLGELLELLPIDLEKRVEEYSRGMRQMLMIIAAFMHDPDFVVLDEPTTGLDPLMRERLLSFLKSEARRGKTIFLSSHVLSEVQKVADRVCLIRGGRIIAIEDLHSLLSKAGKIIRVVVRKPLSLSEIEGKEGVLKARVSEDGREAEIVARSGHVEILEALAGYGIEDVEVRGMTLEELFMYFYQR